MCDCIKRNRRKLIVRLLSALVKISFPSSFFPPSVVECVLTWFCGVGRCSIEKQQLYTRGTQSVWGIGTTRRVSSSSSSFFFCFPVGIDRCLQLWITDEIASLPSPVVVVAPFLRFLYSVCASSRDIKRGRQFDSVERERERARKRGHTE